jgi:hypothetical protein
MTRKTMGARIGVLVLACTSIATGCSGSESSTAGVAQWTLDEDLRIGSTSDPNQALTTVASLAVDDDGLVYIAQPDQGHIRVYDEQGRGVRAIGSPGPQPGQFQRLYTVGLLGDTVYAIDLGLRRITYFSKQGELLGFEQVSPPPVQPPFLPSMPFALFPDGSRAIGTAFPPTLTADQLRLVPQLRMEAGSETLDTVAWIGYERTARRVTWQERPLPVGSPLSDDAFAVFDLDGTRIATIDRPVAPGAGPATFGVTLADGRGDTIWTRRYDYTPIPIENSVVDSIVAQRAETLESAFDDPREATTFARGAMFLPAYYPPVSTAVFGDDGMLWVQRETVPGRQEQWLVIDEEGTPVARAELPVGFQVMAIHDGALWGVTYGGVVPFVVRYRVER